MTPYIRRRISYKVLTAVPILLAQSPELPYNRVDKTGHASDPITQSAARQFSADLETPNQPKRVMGFRDLVLFYVVTGISLRWIATAAAAGPSSIVIWIGAWLVFYIPLAFSVVELSSRYPDEGGLYVWSKK